MKSRDKMLLKILCALLPHVLSDTCNLRRSAICCIICPFSDMFNCAKSKVSRISFLFFFFHLENKVEIHIYSVCHFISIPFICWGVINIVDYMYWIHSILRNFGFK